MTHPALLPFAFQAEKEVERQARLEREMQDIELCKAQLQSEV